MGSIANRKSLSQRGRALSAGSILTRDYSNHLDEIQEAIARRAYELFEERDCVGGHDLEDWLRAESEVLLPISVSIQELDGRLIACAEVPLPTVDDLEVQVQDQRIIICDRGPICVDDNPDCLVFRRVFQAVALPNPVDWATAEIKFKNGVLEISAPKLNSGDYMAA